jgi:biotin carboxyl carrier protein
MIFFIRHQGKEVTVRVESRNQQTLVKFDQEPEQAVDLVYYGNDCTFLQGQRVFHANVVGEKTDYTVWRPEGNLSLSVESEYKRIVNLLRGQELGDENNVYAKMPGKISKIMTKVGSKVEKGNPVLVMEAMKMENEIRVAIDGEVTGICVKEGQAVETGALLIELKPTEG